MRFKSKMKETFFRKGCKDMSIVFVSVICTFAAYAFGLGVETMPNVDLGRVKIFSHFSLQALA